MRHGGNAGGEVSVYRNENRAYPVTEETHAKGGAVLSILFTKAQACDRGTSHPSRGVRERSRRDTKQGRALQVLYCTGGQPPGTKH